MSYKIKNPLLVELKAQGHSIIDQIERMGFAKDRIYVRLAKKLATAGHKAHFSNMKTVEEAGAAVKALYLVRADCAYVLVERTRRKKQLAKTNAEKPPKPPRLPTKTLPLAEQKRILAEMKQNQLRKKTWVEVIHKWFSCLRKYTPWIGG